MKFHTLILAASLSFAFGAHAADWQVDPATSSLKFSGVAEGESFVGSFKNFNPVISFDPADLAASRFEVEITLDSADTGNADRDDTLRGSDFFSVGKFPKARYSANAFRDLGEGKFAADGSLSLRGVEKPVTLEFRWSQTADGASLDGEASVNRIAFDVGGGDWADASTIVHEIGVTTHLSLRPR